MSTPAPPEPKPGESDELTFVQEVRTIPELLEYQRGLITRLQARVVELERVIEAKDEELKRIIRTSTNTNTAELAEDALNLKAAP